MNKRVKRSLYINWAMQATAVAILAAMVVSYGKVSWDTTKILMGASLAFAVGSFVHAFAHYIAESR